MALRSALGLIADSGALGILGLTRTCSGASSSGHGHCGSALRAFSSLLEGGQPASVIAASSPAAQKSQSLNHNSSAWSFSGWLGGSARGYRSNKRSLKPLNTSASWQAVQPVIEGEKARQEVLDGQASPALLRRRPRPRLGPIVDTCLPPIPKVQLPTEYKRVGVITGDYALELEPTFAVVQLAGTQFKVTTDDIVFVNQLPGVEVNDVLALDRVMLLGSRSETIVGRPYIPGATVLAAVEEHFRDGKVHVFKKKRKKRYRKYQAPRPNLMTLRILQVRGIDPAPGDRVGKLPELPVEWEGRFRRLMGRADMEEQVQQIEVGAAAV